MAVLEAKSTPVRLCPPEQGHHPGTGFGIQDLGRGRLPQPWSFPGLTLSLGGLPNTQCAASGPREESPWSRREEGGEGLDATTDGR